MGEVGKLTQIPFPPALSLPDSGETGRALPKNPGFCKKRTLVHCFVSPCTVSLYQHEQFWRRVKVFTSLQLLFEE